MADGIKPSRFHDIGSHSNIYNTLSSVLSFIPWSVHEVSGKDSLEKKIFQPKFQCDDIHGIGGFRCSDLTTQFELLPIKKCDDIHGIGGFCCESLVNAQENVASSSTKNVTFSEGHFAAASKKQAVNIVVEVPAPTRAAPSPSLQALLLSTATAINIGNSLSS